MSKLKREELLGQIDTWLICCKSDGIKVYGSCKKCPCIEICKQAEQQIKELTQKPEVTEEWIEEKAKKMVAMMYRLTQTEPHLGDHRFNHSTIKNFIRSLIEVIK